MRSSRTTPPSRGADADVTHLSVSSSHKPPNHIDQISNSGDNESQPPSATCIAAVACMCKGDTFLTVFCGGQRHIGVSLRPPCAVEHGARGERSWRLELRPPCTRGLRRFPRPNVSAQTPPAWTATLVKVCEEEGRKRPRRRKSKTGDQLRAQREEGYRKATGGRPDNVRPA